MSSPFPDTLTAAVERCADEPIHIPGGIQPHGFLLVVAEADLRVLQVSANVSTWLGLQASSLLGLALPELIDDPELPARLAGLSSDDLNPFHLGDVRFFQGTAQARSFALMGHRLGQQLILEFEQASNPGEAYGILYPLMRTFVAELHAAKDLEAICQLAVNELSRISGFGRVKAYRFDDDGNGEVLAERAEPEYASYLGHRFPASDIPAQARQLYCKNLIRLIPDATYQPSPMVPELSPLDQQPLDLSFASLRSVSPVHLQYMRNMGTLASMSVSIVVRDRLWGLISCHDANPRQLSHKTRTTCELLARILALQIDATESGRQAQRKLELRHLIVRLLAGMADYDSVTDGFRNLPDVVLAFAKAQGAAVVTADTCVSVGAAPADEQIIALAHWLGSQERGPLFSSDNIGRDVPQLPELAAHSAGVLAVSISKLHAHYLIWFRQEQVQTVKWAGQPNKQLDQASGALSPRHSFDTWREVVRGYSAPWEAAECEGALELRNAVLGIVLRKAEEMAALAGELRESNKELESFSYSVSHDLRAPLRHIAGYTELLGELEGEQLSERGKRFLLNISEAARFAGVLVDNLLSFSQMGRSALHLSDVDLDAMVSSIREEMRPDYDQRQVEWRIQPLPVVVADASFLHMVLRNLLSNALKYSSRREQTIIEMGATQDADETVVFIRDNGVGFDMQYANKLFGVFQRLHRMEEFEGTGIGLASVRRIIERHGGRVWADGRIDQGATFFFALPRLTYTTPPDDRNT
ncbi:ATP-binding protein [Pseudomonas sp. GV071]|uniref:ATP-binding protein n=1 Tax=Pseudomonas sp. GV071 TaxID=2135754 RepID=UPI000D3BEB37|nr:ATP-binding protein [Pseudomonas sp. GV071]PTQ74283.1 light-regulated signal transduction histidine kinase (bacteriophytochrome) [Pseudomonas sp. GV071]